MSERFSRIFLLPSLSSCSMSRGNSSSRTPTASRPWKSTMTTSPFFRVSMFTREIIYRVNLLLLHPEDFVSATRARISGRRLDEVNRIGSDELRVGVIDGRIGTATVIAPGELDVRLDSDPPPPLPLTLILALPRPKVLSRVIAGAASMGIKKIFLINAWRVEKSYWKSPKLLHLRDHAILGLEQARDTVMPQIELRRFFRKFVEDEVNP